MSVLHVTVFCGASPSKNREFYLDLARRFGEYLARSGYHCVNGGTKGMLKEVSRGAREAGGQVHCVSMAKYAMDHDHYTEHEEFATLSARQLRLVELGDAFVALPGGIGTMFEIFEVLAKKGTGEISIDKPLICVGKEFALLKMLLQALNGFGFLREDPFELIVFVNTAEEAMRILNARFARA